MNRIQRLLEIRWVKVAAAILIAMVVFTTGFAAEKIVDTVKARRLPPAEIDNSYKLTLPSGKTVEISQMASKAQKNARRDEIKQLIAEKKYRFIKPFDINGETQYLYEFKLTTGPWGESYPYPLEKVTDWNDLQKKIARQKEQRRADIQDAVKNGRYRLVNIEALTVHICRDVETGKKIRVQSYGSDEKREAFTSDANSPPGETTITSWDDHLRAIATGSRELIDIDVVKNCTYDLTRADGTKFRWTFAGELLPSLKGKSASKPAGSGAPAGSE